MSDNEKAPLDLLVRLLQQLGLNSVLWEEGLERACNLAEERVRFLTSERGVEIANNQHVGNLLAVIHGDGGHHLLEHGLEKACLDAEKVVTDLRMSVAALEESHDILVHSEDPW